MRPEELKKLEYGFSDGVFILFVNGTEEWRRTRSEYAENRFFLGTIRIHVGNGEFAFAVYPRRWLSDIYKMERRKGKLNSSIK